MSWWGESDMEDGMRSGSGRDQCPECGEDLRFADHDVDCPEYENEKED